MDLLWVTVHYAYIFLILGTIVVGGLCRHSIPYLPKHYPELGNYSSFRTLSHIIGIVLTVNFVLFWSWPIFLQGVMWKQVLSPILRPWYERMDASPAMRQFAEKYIYTNARHTDFWAQTTLLLVDIIISLTVMVGWQMYFGTIPWWLLILYYFSWVGLGGRVMGGAYTFAHKEGHSRTLYKKWIQKSFGNIFENFFGPFFGNVPNNFTTSHIVIHHKLDGGKGDTFYQWDLDRTSWSDFMLFLHRILLHTIGISSIKYFEEYNFPVQRQQLVRGCFVFWIAVPLGLLFLTRSLPFLFWFYIQPFVCMTFFLAFMNFGFHGFWEVDSDTGKGIWCINSITIVEDDDDYFGESDHMQHHHALQVYYKDLPEYREGKMDEFKVHHASIFKRFSILELSLFILMKNFSALADHYVDYSKSLSKEKIMEMLKVRAERKETTHEEYMKWLQTAPSDRQ
eukprot:RCo046244